MKLTNLLAIVVAYFELAFCWREWLYETEWAYEGVNKQAEWKLVWGEVPPPGARNVRETTGAPRPRSGHSLVQAEYKGDQYIVLFGGRDNNKMTQHIPKTYDIAKENGTIRFTTYDEKPVNPCTDTGGRFYDKAARDAAGCNPGTNYSQIQIGVFYNDVWAYKLCNVHGDNFTKEEPNAARYFDTQCESQGWVLWNPGAKEGGCTIQLGILVCNTPSERYEHAAVMFNDGLMYVYGGFSQRCADYCDDLWFFDIYLKAWREAYPVGQLSRLYFEYTTTTESGIIPYSTKDVPRDNSAKQWAGPGARWKHSMTKSKAYNSTNGTFSEFVQRQKMAVFGGHRLWHGYSSKNQESNDWSNYDERPPGGYLDDLWIYTKELDFLTIPGSTFKTNVGVWKKMLPKKVCFDAPGLSWDSRHQKSCRTVWPPGRAGHGSAWDDKRNLLWIFGGYNTYYPYISTDGPGSGAGVSSLGSGGFVPYPGYTYFLNDLWFFNFTSELWTEITFDEAFPIPAPRTGHVFLLMEDIFFIHGGYADNTYFDDTWYFNITTGRWLEKKRHIYPRYPPNCTDDREYIDAHPNCTHLSWPLHLERDNYYPFDILPYYRQQYYWPDPENGPYYGILPKKENPVVDYFNKLDDLTLPLEGTPEFPFAATGPIQFAQKFFYSFNSTHNATLLASCVSVAGEPTRGKLTDGIAGRASAPLFIPQIRRQRPGWDGCRDRDDGRTDLPNVLQYVKPYARAHHKAIFYAEKNEIFVYGGTGYITEQAPSTTTTYSTQSLDDMWYFNLFHCINNCSRHGDCFYGFCRCYTGYYGEDCSNVTCPGTFCYYDEYTNEQVCVHGCQAGYRHTDNDTYVQDIYKLPCTRENPGESNGICDGYGKSQCAPPFVGDDCSTKDCKNNCSFNGWCSIEYPVSRCMCQPGYFGDICEHKMCLNNCSYPHGVCNITSGQCNCRAMFNPYNNTQYYHNWEGEDCSYLWAYSASPRSGSAFPSLLDIFRCTVEGSLWGNDVRRVTWTVFGTEMLVFLFAMGFSFAALFC